jgi:alpha-D-ribose 1-methylphosphonate 5-triphosphate synthase subunit PhnH
VTVTPLSPELSQGIFRAVLDALARPGTLHRLPARDDVPAALLPLLALADLSTPVCVLADDTLRDDTAGDDAAGDDWPGTVRALTSAPVTPLRAARLVAALRPLTAADFGEIQVGTAAAPEDGALVTLAIASFSYHERRTLLSGPGIPGRLELRAGGLPAGFTEFRRRLTGDFPAGADFLLVAPDGTMVGLPRTTVLAEAGLEEAGLELAEEVAV